MSQLSIRIVVVDDDVQVGKAIIRALNLENIRASYYDNPSDVLSLIEKGAIDVLITDYSMPVINGLELLHQLKHHNPLALGMLITGQGDFSLAVSAINEGSIIHFFTKPFKNEELIDTVNKAISIFTERYHLEALRTADLDPLNSDSTHSLQELIHKNVIEGLTHLLKAKDEALYHHSKRISNLCKLFGESLQLSMDDLQLLELGGLFHDIGKLAIKDQILDKPSKLNADEYTSMKRHPQVGAELLEKLGVDKRVVDCVLQHHENVNGSGYPSGLKEGEISLDARIVSIVDAYDALRSDRVYKAGYDFSTTKQMMYAMADVIYDRLLLDKFFTFIIK